MLIPLDSAPHQAISRQTKSARNAAGRERRGTGGLVYRKVPVVVSIIETTDADGGPLLLATSDAPNEAGRYFRVWRQGGRWKCRCSTHLALNGCHHVGHLAAQDSEESEISNQSAERRER